MGVEQHAQKSRPKPREEAPALLDRDSCADIYSSAKRRREGKENLKILYKMIYQQQNIEGARRLNTHLDNSAGKRWLLQHLGGRAARTRCDII